jgi:2-polyprenyl-6-methoxyphenol hydroxylase-like FAD-dependent oxidoreductase
VTDEIAIIGGGVAGLALALGLHQRGFQCTVFEAAPEVKEIGVGITLLPHAMRELTALGLGEAIAQSGIENTECRFYNRFGQLLYSEPRGRFGGYAYPEFGIHRGRLHRILFDAAFARLGAAAIRTNRQLVELKPGDDEVALTFKPTVGEGACERIDAKLVIGCDGVNSTVRRHFHPNDPVVFTGINTWRGVTRRKPILDGRTYLRIGSINTGKIVIYPIADNIDERGRQLINWIAEIRSDSHEKNDWNKPGRKEDFLPVYADQKFDWLDVGALIEDADLILEYPMVDRDPLSRWTHGRVTLMGDAAHPMYPRGSNGAAQALVDARTLCESLVQAGDALEALIAYERARLGPTSQVVLANRSTPPDLINMRVEELTGDRPFENLDAVISQGELRSISDRYKKIAGFSVADVV